MIGTMEYTRCSDVYTGKSCPNACGWCHEHSLDQPQCFDCYHWKQLDCSCSIHGKLPHSCGCCGLFVKAELEYCVNGWAHRREWGLDCGWIDTIGCEECQKRYYELCEM